MNLNLTHRTLSGEASSLSTWRIGKRSVELVVGLLFFALPLVEISDIVEYGDFRDMHQLLDKSARTLADLETSHMQKFRMASEGGERAARCLP